MCHFLLSGYLKSSDESQKGIVNRLLNHLAWQRDEVCGKFAYRSPTLWRTLRRKREIFSLQRTYGSCLSQKKRGYALSSDLVGQKVGQFVKRSFV